MGIPTVPAQAFAPFFSAGPGLRSEFGMFVPPGVNIVYLRSTGASNADPPEIAKRLTKTLAQALLQCRAGAGDIIAVLPGHAENVTDATMLTNLVAGTRIIGMVDPVRDDAPTFTWTAAGSQWSITKKNVEFSNLRLYLDGFNGVTKAIVTTAARAKFINCYFRLASGASNIATIGLECGTGADDFLVQGCMADAVTGAPTDGIKIVGVNVKRPSVVGCRMMGTMNATNGFIHITAASLATGVLVQGNVLYNTGAGSTACIAVDAAVIDGMICDNYLGVLNNAVAATQGITMGAGCTIKAFQNFCSDEPQKSGALSPAVVAT